MMDDPALLNTYILANPQSSHWIWLEQQFRTPGNRNPMNSVATLHHSLSFYSRIFRKNPRRTTSTTTTMTTLSTDIPSILLQPIVTKLFHYYWLSLYRAYGTESFSSASSSSLSSALQPCIHLSLSVAKVSTVVTITITELYNVYYPFLLYFILPMVYSAPSLSRQLYGIIGPAGAGKSTLACILVILGNHLYPWIVSCWGETNSLDDTTIDDPEIFLRNLEQYRLSVQLSLSSSSSSSVCPRSLIFQTLSMDAYHFTNHKLEELNLRPQKGAIHTIDAETLAYDLAYAKYYNFDTHMMDTNYLPLFSIPNSVLPAISSTTVRNSGDQVTMDTDLKDTLWFPEYDRSITHDPVSGQIPVTKYTRIIFVEGLYLCSSSPVFENTISLSSSSFVSESSKLPWTHIRSLLTEVWALDIPLQECAERVIHRKTLTSNYSFAAAEKHFITVDLPVWHTLQRDMHKCLPYGPNHTLQIQPTVHPNSITENKFLPISWESILTQCNEPIAFTVWEEEWKIQHQERTTTKPPLSGSQPTILLLGFNPCVQSTLLFGPVQVEASSDIHQQSCTMVFRSPNISSSLSTTKGYWQRGEVNRATYNGLTCGGKGQHTLLAILRHGTNIRKNNVFGHDPESIVIPRVYLAQFLGNYNGEQVIRYLQNQLRTMDPRNEDEKDNFPKGSSITMDKTYTPADNSSSAILSSPYSLSPHAISLTVDISLFTSTRTCTTLIDSHQLTNDMTELVGPSNTLPSVPYINDMQTKLHHFIDEQTKNYSLQCIALCGTVPPGVESLYEDTLKYYYSRTTKHVTDFSSDDDSSSSSSSVPVVLLDCVKNILPLLFANYITIIKINVEELFQLAKDIVNGSSSSSSSSTTTMTASNKLHSSSIDTSPSYYSLHENTESDQRQRKLFILNTVMQIFTWLDKCIGSNAGSLRLRHFAITDGPSVAYLVERTVHNTGTSTFTVWEYHLPILDHILHQMNIIDTTASSSNNRTTVVYNPIGAGDTVTGVLLASLVLSQFTMPISLAFGYGLSAGSASCCTLYGAEYSYQVQKCIQANIWIRTWTITTVN